MKNKNKTKEMTRDKKASVPKCPHAKKCGGCRYQGAAYEKQLAIKQKRMNELLGGFVRVQPIIGMKDPLHYRYKVQSAFGTDARGRIVSGMYKPSTHDIVPADDCLIEDETAARIIRDIREMMPRFKMEPYDELRERGFLRHVLVRRGYATGEVLVVLVATRSYFPAEKPFLNALLLAHPEITTVVLNVNDRFTSMVLGRQEKVLFGTGYIEDELCGKRFRISARSFYQVNPRQAELLYRTAIDFAALTAEDRLLDAYCGTGTIGLCAADRAKEVIGVELNSDAVRDAAANARLNGTKNAFFVQGDAGDFLTEAAARGEAFSAVILDPPRNGCEKAFLDALIRTSPRRIVYVSCGPESLARDLKLLTAGGYRVEKIRPVDMFPFTEHTEVVCLLTRSSSEKSGSTYQH